MDDFVGEGMLEAHHLFHEGAVNGEAGEEGEDAIPADEVVVNAALNLAEHLGEDCVAPSDFPFGDVEEFAEFAIDVFVDAGDEGVGEWTGDAAVGFGDVAIVPYGEFVVRVREFGEGGDGAALEEPELLVLVEGPFDVLG